jgi:peptidoglycan/LPS O-acetylase OafA/YrhL
MTIPKLTERLPDLEKQAIPDQNLLLEESLNRDTKLRRYDLDWIRVLVILMLIPFHTALIFLEDEPFYVKNGQLSMAFDGFVSFVNTWGMQLLFVIAGAASWFAIRNVSAGQFFKKKLLRLLLPLLFGVVVIVPPLAYFARLYHTDYRESYWQFYPHFFEFDSSDVTGYNGHFGPAHLWFLLFLFVLSVVALPVFAWLKKESGRRFTAWLVNICEKPGIIFLGSIPLILVDGFPNLGSDSRNLLKCLVYLLFGYVLMSDPRFQPAIDRQKYWALLLVISSSVTFAVVREWGLSQPSFSLGSIIFYLLKDLMTWTIILALFGFGHSYLNFRSKAWKYFNEASYPVYLLHLTVIIAIGFYVVQWDINLFLKYLIIVPGSFVVTLALYELVIRRLNFARLLFGMKPISHKA